MNQISTDKTLTNLNTLIHANCINIDENKAISIFNEMYTKCVSKEEKAALTMAIKAVRKEIKTPLQYVYDGLGGAPLVCPNCGAALYDSDWYESTKSKYHHNRCVCCGQRIDWNVDAKSMKMYEGRTVYSPIR